MRLACMNRVVLLLLVLTFISCRNVDQPVSYVDPFICTQGDHGHWLPAALVPFGLVELCPDTWPGSLTADGDLAHSGYDWSDGHIRGFSHIHRGSSGGGSIHDRAGLISLVPFTSDEDAGFFSNPVVETDKASEKASAGYYAVRLKKDDILAELTATPRVGVHRYTFPEGSKPRIFLNSGKRGVPLTCTLVSPNRLEGSAGHIHFVAEFSAPVTQTFVWNSSGKTEGRTITSEPGGGIICRFGEMRDRQLTVRVGISLTGCDAAAENLLRECGDQDFAAIRQNAEHAWNEILSGIQVEGGTREDRTIFYTALYHSCFLPMVINDADGTYPGLDRQNHRAEGYQHYNNYAFWDSFRTKYPLYSLWIPGVYSDIVQSLRDIYSQAGNWDPFPDNDHPPHGFCYTVRGKDGYQSHTTCRHEHMLMVMADAWFKGIFEIPLASVYDHMRHETMIQMPERYDSIGFIPARPDQTGEYSWDSWCMAQLARELGREDDFRYFMRRAEYWRNTWDPSIRFFRARAADGSWLDFPENPEVNREKYTYEGSKWHLRWNVIHDVPGLIDIFGGRENFLRDLEYFFDHDLYTAGNQIDLHVPFLFNMAGAPWLTQKWVRKILTEPIVQKYGTHDFFPEPIYDRVYKSTPDGYLLEMDCDYGCMAAWYAMSAMGLYQVCPGNPVYQLSTPIFDKITIRPQGKTGKGKSFIIKAEQQGAEHDYIRSATLNGKPFSRSWLTHDELAAGGELVLVLGNEPNKAWGLE